MLLPRGRSYAGLWVAAALKLSERLPLDRYRHFSDSPEQFTKLLLLQRVLDSEPWLTDTAVLDDDSKVAEKLGRVEMDRLWQRVKSMDSEGLKPQPGSHSFHIVTADCQGNFVTGTNTINTLPWGEGLFVGGIPLSTAGNLVGFATEPGERRLSAMAPWLIVDSKTKKWKVAGGNFGASLNLAGFQLITNLIRYGDDAKTAVSRPRFGTYPVDWSNFQSQKDANWIDDRVPQDVRDHAFSKGIRLVVDPRGDLGPSSIIGRKNKAYEPAWSLSLGSDARDGVSN